MASKKIFVVIFALLFYSSLLAKERFSQDSEQKIQEFSLVGYGDKGKKSWDIFGKSADIFTDLVKLQDITGNLYGEKEHVRLKAQKGDFNKKDGRVHLEDDVVITTSQGAKLTTMSLDWDRQNNSVSTHSAVNIQKGYIFAKGQGARGEPNLKKVTLEKDVQVDIALEAQEKSKNHSPENKITITCEGPLEIDYEKSIATFNNNVKVHRQEAQIYSDRMLLYFTASKNKAKSDDKVSLLGSKIEKILAQGNVRIVRGENISYSDEALYTAADNKITLSGRPQLVIYSTEDSDASFGD